MNQLLIGNVVVTVYQKNIKHMYLRVYPPNGEIVLTCPFQIRKKDINHFIISRLAWIKEQQQKIVENNSKELLYIHNEWHELWGEKYPLVLVENAKKNQVQFNEKHFVMNLKTEVSAQQKQKLFLEFYRLEMKQAFPRILKHYEQMIRVKTNECFIKNMKTKWGTCNITKKRIWLNVQLAKKMPLCLEYVVVHELLHLLESNHNKKFYHYLDLYFPRWREAEKLLQG